MLDLRNFVNVNINYNQTPKLSSITRGIVTFITSDTSFDAASFKEESGKPKVLYSLADYNNAKESANIGSKSLQDGYISAFFSNKGKAIQIIPITEISSASIATKIHNIIMKLDYQFVIIVSDVAEWDLRAAAQISGTTVIESNPLNDGTVNALSGLNEKMFVSSIKNTDGYLYDRIPAQEEVPEFEVNTYFESDETSSVYTLLTEEPADWDTDYTNYFTRLSTNPTLDNYLCKIGEKGIEMLAAAFLSQVDLNNANTISDYRYTIENIKGDGFDFTSSVVEDNAEGVLLLDRNFNFDAELVNAIRNQGGDTISGIDFMNYYIKILLTQTVTERIISILASKIKFNQTGINRVMNAISQEMNTYISNGYLNTDFIWTEDDLYYSFNGRNYLVCSRNTPLVKGYKAIIIPIAALTEEQRNARVFPPVYILLADQLSPRVIVINGDVYH